MSGLYHLIYCSRADLVGGDKDSRNQIHNILSVSRRNNARDGITGALLFTAGCFVQMLEGDLEKVEQTYERIQLDMRHANLTVLDFGPSAARLFRRWSMAFHDQAGDAPAAVAAAARMSAIPGASAEQAMALLRGVASREREWAEAV